jgi:hypothetical protein
MLRKKKEPEKQKQTIVKKVPGAKIIDFSVLKDWFEYSHNRTMSGLKLANAADIKAAEMERDMKKAGRDWNVIIPSIAVIVIVGVVAFMLIMQFGNISEKDKELGSCIKARSECDGTLSVCQEQLKEYEPEVREITPEINI